MHLTSVMTLRSLDPYRSIRISRVMYHKLSENCIIVCVGQVYLARANVQEKPQALNAAYEHNAL